MYSGSILWCGKYLFYQVQLLYTLTFQHLKISVSVLWPVESLPVFVRVSACTVSSKHQAVHHLYRGLRTHGASSCKTEASCHRP